MDAHKVYVGCCMVILNPAGDKVLVAKRKKEPDQGGLQLPGGTVDYGSGEDLNHAVVREIQEEVGLTIPDPEFLCMMNTFYYGSERPLHIAFVGRAKSEELPANPEPQKAEDWQWVPLADLPEVKWFRMSKIAIDFYTALQNDPSLNRSLTDAEYPAPLT